MRRPRARPREARMVPLVLCRRQASEQRVIRMLRAESVEDEDRFAIYAGQFEKLRRLAERNMLVIQQPGVAYLSTDELRRLAWLAQAQRITSYPRQFHCDPMLNITIVHCAGTLDALGIRLPSLSLCNPSVR